MKNIHQIFQDMLKIDDFLVLERQNKNYFLYPAKDQSLIINQDQSIQSYKINITLLYQELIKFITSLTNSLSKMMLLQQMIEGILLNLEEKPIIAEMIENQLFNYQAKLENNQIINKQLMNQNSQFKISHKLQNIINNYQALVIQLCYEKDDLVLKFENPSKISFTELKSFEFDKIPLKIQEDFNVHECSFQINNSRGQLENVLEILKKQQIILSVKHLELDLDLKQSVNVNDFCRGEEFEETHGFYHLPDIPTNYIFLNLECSQSYGRSVALCFHLQPVLQNDKYRGKITIMNQTEDYVIQQFDIAYNDEEDDNAQSDYSDEDDNVQSDYSDEDDNDVNVKDVGTDNSEFQDINGYGLSINCENYNIFKIPSIIDEAQCYVYGYKLQNQKELKELFLEDQILLKIAVLQKNNISNLLYMSISQIITDLFY